MFELRCPVRNCNQPLQQMDGGCRCVRGHHFDQAKEGYWSLLQPQDRKSLNPGDRDEAVVARRRWMQQGHASGLIDELANWIQNSGLCCLEGFRVLDLGCGEGSFGRALFPDSAESFCGIDLSKRAIKLAARRWPAATWVFANADRTLPVVDRSVHLVMSLFGRRPAAEIYRVLIPGGRCVIAVPGEEDLIELRASVQQSGHRRSRWEIVVEQLTEQGLQFVDHRLWHRQVDLDSDAIADALAMTYRAVRRSQHSRAETLSAMNVTLAADLMLLQRPAD